MLASSTAARSPFRLPILFRQGASLWVLALINCVLVAAVFHSSVAATLDVWMNSPEYNYGPPPSLLNALNYLYLEWNYKPASFVSYGGVSGGMRAVQVEKLTLTTLKIVPIPESVVIPMVSHHIEGGRFQPSDLHATAAITMLAELARWAECLKPMRQHSST